MAIDAHIQTTNMKLTLFIFLLSIFGSGAFFFQSSQHPSVALRHATKSNFPLSLQPTFQNEWITPPLSSRTTLLMERRASEASFGYTGILSTNERSFGTIISVFLQGRQSWFGWASNTLCNLQQVLRKSLLQSWWILPMLLTFVPVYCAIFKGTCASMPSWWPVVKMDYIRQSRDAALVIGGFLLSNVAYFISGTLLLNRFPCQAMDKGVVRVQPTKFTMLGIWILLAGAVSTIFHSVQALGSYAIAESLCYIDHGVAISACFYYFKTCGLPSKKVWTLGMAGLAALVCTEPGYAILHSTWHFLSATAATKWAIEGYDRTKS